MTFQAYLDSIKAKTGLGPDDFRKLAMERGLLEPGVKVGEILTWLHDDFQLGRGHGMAIVSTIQDRKPVDRVAGDSIAQLFGGGKAHWRDTYDELIKTLSTFGPVRVSPTDSYISLRKGNGKFGVVAVTGDRLDIGIKLKGAPVSGRFESAEKWNPMVTHRVRVTEPSDIDAELLEWLRRAYDRA